MEQYGETMMGQYGAVGEAFMIMAVIIILVTGFVIARKIYRLGTEQEETMSDDRLVEIEKRLEVLEQIVTSENYELKQQFKNIENS